MPHGIKLCFENYFKNDQPKDSRIKKIINYLDKTYIKNDATFPPSFWAKKEATLEKTTNNCESFHAKFGNLFTSEHPNITVFVKNLLAMQTDSYIQMNSVNNNESRIVRTKQKTNSEFINKNIELYNDGQIAIYNFVKSLALFNNIYIIIVLHLILYKRRWCLL
jgi:hypothetical protein